MVAGLCVCWQSSGMVVQTVAGEQIVWIGHCVHGDVIGWATAAACGFSHSHCGHLVGCGQSVCGHCVAGRVGNAPPPATLSPSAQCGQIVGSGGHSVGLGGQIVGVPGQTVGTAGHCVGFGQIVCGQPVMGSVGNAAA
jgi:hypothetical protein